jgi:hypothetical protein
MKIIAHRGFWKEPYEKNSKIAFSRAINNGFGIETDVRDYFGSLVISHDIPLSGVQTFKEFLDCYLKDSITQIEPPFLAINIKADGLQSKLKELLEEYKITNYFVFDMTIPDTIIYLNSDINVFMRKSEYEDFPESISNINGIWLDQFNSDWYTEEFLNMQLYRWNYVCVVSPELHGRKYNNCWKLLKKVSEKENNKLMLCTDYPKQAKEYFGEKFD